MAGYEFLVRLADKVKGLREEVDKLKLMQFIDVSGLMVQEGVNRRMGLESGAGTSVAGTNSVVNTTKITAVSRVFVSVQGNVTGGVPTFLVTTRTAGVSFTMTGYVGSGTGSADVAWLIVEPV